MAARRLDAWVIILLFMFLGVAVAFLPSVPRRHDPCRNSCCIHPLTTKPSTTATTRRCSTVVYSNMDDDEKTKDQKDSSFLDARMSEIEAMGGDPFFLSDVEDLGIDSATSEDDDDDAVSLSAADQLLLMSTAASAPDALVKRYATDGLGPSSPRNSVPYFGEEKPKKESAVFQWDGIVDEEAHLDLDF